MALNIGSLTEMAPIDARGWKFDKVTGHYLLEDRLYGAVARGCPKKGGLYFNCTIVRKMECILESLKRKYRAQLKDFWFLGSVHIHWLLEESVFATAESWFCSLPSFYNGFICNGECSYYRTVVKIFISVRQQVR